MYSITIYNAVNLESADRPAYKNTTEIELVGNTAKNDSEQYFSTISEVFFYTGWKARQLFACLVASKSLEWLPCNFPEDFVAISVISQKIVSQETQLNGFRLSGTASN